MVFQYFLALALTLLSAGLFPTSASAMTLKVQGHTLFASGPVEDDYRKFTEALDKNPIEQVVFVNSPGGDLWTGMNVGRLIADRGLRTVVAGRCVSACSIMFMGGTSRTFSDAFHPAQTYIGIHGPHSKRSGQVLPEFAAQIYAFFKIQMGAQFRSDIMNTALYDMQDAGSLLRVFDAYRAPKRVMYHCKSEQSLRKDCTEYKEQDAYTLGLVTSVTLTPVDLPNELKTVPRIPGNDLTGALAEADLFYQGLVATQCQAEPCKRAISEFPTKAQHNALAIPMLSSGYGFASNRESTTNAFLAALYFCNHLKDRAAKLCEVQVVDGYDVRPLYQQAEQSHVAALQELRPPAGKSYGNEEYGGAFTSANGLRTQKLHDITPPQLDGIRTIGTQELATLLKSPQPPVLVDVLYAPDEVLPGARSLSAGGLAYDDPTTDAAYEARFLGLLKLLSPDATHPLVFYCLSRDCWLSANAAMRARKLGYSQVLWYRGGWTSWKSAGLPTAKPLIRAVVD